MFAKANSIQQATYLELLFTRKRKMENNYSLHNVFISSYRPRSLLHVLLIFGYLIEHSVSLHTPVYVGFTNVLDWISKSYASQHYCQ